MKIAIMQPYIFPYLGYFQLVSAVDKFIIFDDVAYINRGWINRNKILVNGSEHIFTVPLKKASQNRLINTIEIAADATWKTSFLKTLERNYKKSPEYNRVFPLIESLVNAPEKNVSVFVYKSLAAIFDYLGIVKDIVPSSAQYATAGLKGVDKIIAICKKESACTYVNPIGGVQLYDKDVFSENGIKLRFIKMKPIEYRQWDVRYVPNLSVIDALMFNSKESMCRLLASCELVEN